MTIKDIEKSYGICGLVCALCSYNKTCAGCRMKNDDCEIKTCCRSKGLTYCYLCAEWPCEKKMHKGIRIRAFNSVAKSEGLEKLAEYLYKNTNRGIFYHRPDGLTGDYDKCKTEQDVIELLKNGRPDPYGNCPVYETEHFILRFISSDDAADLLECYSDPKAQQFFNADYCTSDFRYSTLEEMQNCIEGWLYAYQNGYFVRFGIVDKPKSKAVGTVEIFGGDYGVLRIDIKSDYENKSHLSELIQTADAFFDDFNCEKIVAKAVPASTERIAALTAAGFEPFDWEPGREHYYMKRRP
ncbi:MAG TPA: GNAT family N-acetyltransferase [Oscillospiraceae bacterium]|nr:GNAT family N-acetyltransferase [Oscillospiraceae bacterium]HPR76278.1 GNAT family N-acetyltransferase [Oscillospiraceae bacterium]